MPIPDLGRRLFAEWLGTAFLLMTVVGSGIMAEALAAGNTGIALLGNTLATGCILAVLILIFGPISGAHFNPAVTISFTLSGDLPWTQGAAYVLVQIGGAVVGVMLAHLMFDAPLLTFSARERAGVGQWLGEFVATFGLLATIWGCLRFRPEAVAYAVGLFISAGYWFTSSTSFANPAVTLARALTDTFAGIRPLDVPGFIAAEVAAALVATAVLRWLLVPAVSAAQPAVSKPSRVLARDRR